MYIEWIKEFTKLTFGSDTAVAGDPVEKCHIIKAVGGKVLVNRGHAVGKLLANVGKVTLGRLIS